MTNATDVLLLTNTYPTEQEPGATPCIKDQVIALRAKGVRIELFYVNRFNKLNYARIAWKVFLMSFKTKEYDLIHAHYGHCGLMARLQFRYPIIVTFHGSDLLGKDGLIGKVAARLVEGVIVMTEEMKHVVGRPDAHVIPFGVNAEVFSPCPTMKARHDLGLPLDEKLVLFPWNPARRVKRFDIVQEAIQLLKQDHEKVRLLVVFNQPREIIAKYMNACDAMILASDSEGSPMAIREAMACNLPIVSVDVGDVRQIIGNTDGCYVCSQEARDLAGKLGQVLSWGARTDGSQAIKRMDAAWAARRVLSVYDLVLNCK